MRFLSTLAIAALSTFAQGQLAQDYPSTSQDWNNASTAINGGVAVSEAILPNPEPIRDTIALFAAVWSSITPTPWDTSSRGFANPMWNTPDPSEITGDLSDGMPFVATINKWRPITNAELISQADSSTITEIESLNAVAAMANITIETSYGSTQAVCLYYEIDNPDSSGRLACIYPFNHDSTIYVQADGSGVLGGPGTSSCPDCSQCVMSDDLRTCLNEADDAYDNCMGGIIPDLAKGSPSFLGGFIPGVVTSLVILAVDSIVCDNIWYDGLNNCISTYCTHAHWDDAGHLHWDLIR